jgi:hypothetical protein
MKCRRSLRLTIKRIKQTKRDLLYKIEKISNRKIISTTNDYIKNRLEKSNKKIKIFIDPVQIYGFNKYNTNDSIYTEILNGGSFKTMADNLPNLKSFNKIYVLLDHSNIHDYSWFYGYEFLSLLKSYTSVTIYSTILHNFDDGNKYDIFLILPCSQCIRHLMDSDNDIEDLISCNNPQFYEFTEKTWLEKYNQIKRWRNLSTIDGIY